MAPEMWNTLVAMIREEHKGQSVLIVGHSTTVPAIVQEFGADPPITIIPEDDYDNLFVVLAWYGDDEASVSHQTYGAPSPSEMSPVTR